MVLSQNQLVMRWVICDCIKLAGSYHWTLCAKFLTRGCLVTLQTKVNSLRVKMSEMYESVAKKRTELGILQRTQTLSAILDAQVRLYSMGFIVPLTVVIV